MAQMIRTACIVAVLFFVAACGTVGMAQEDPVAAWIEALQDPERVLEAAYGLDDLGPDTALAVSHFEAALHHEDARVRRYTAGALGEWAVRPERTAPLLIEALGDADADVRAHATVALIKIGAPAVPELAAALRDVPPTQVGEYYVYENWSSGIPIDLHHYLLLALSEIGSPAVPALRAALRDGDPAARLTAVLALWMMGPDAADAAPELRVALKDPVLEVRYVALYAVASLGRQGLLDAAEAAVSLAGVLVERRPDVTRFNFYHGDHNTLYTNYYDLRNRTEQALWHLGPADTTRVLPLLQDARRQGYEIVATERFDLVAQMDTTYLEFGGTLIRTDTLDSEALGFEYLIEDIRQRASRDETDESEAEESDSFAPVLANVVGEHGNLPDRFRRPEGPVPYASFSLPSPDSVLGILGRGPALTPDSVSFQATIDSLIGSWGDDDTSHPPLLDEIARESPTDLLVRSSGRSALREERLGLFAERYLQYLVDEAMPIEVVCEYFGNCEAWHAFVQVLAYAQAYPAEVVPILAGVLEERDGRQPRVMRVLALIGPEAAAAGPVLVEALTKALANGDRDVLARAVMTLQAIGYDLQRNDLVDRLRTLDLDEQIRNYVNERLLTVLLLFYPLEAGGGGAGVALPSFAAAFSSSSMGFKVDNPSFATEDQTLREVYEALKGILRDAGFTDLTTRNLQEGFALVTKLERVDAATGAPVPGKDRFTRGKRKPRSLSDYFDRLFFAAPGHYRFFVIAVTPERLTAGTGQDVGLEEYDEWFGQDEFDLHEAVAEAPFAGKSCYAFVYHLVRERGGAARLIGKAESPWAPAEHLEKANIVLASTRR